MLNKMNRYSLRKIKKQTRLAVALLSFFVFLVGVSVDMYRGLDSKKIDGGLSTDTQLGQVKYTVQEKPEILSDSKKDSQKLVRVVKVVDGDTITVQEDESNPNTKMTLRLIGINTPETVDPRKKVQCFGKEASSKAKEILLGNMARIEYDETQNARDRYGRGLAYIYVPIATDDISEIHELSLDSTRSELFFNKFMIASGYAYEYTYDKPYMYQAEFKKAQREAEDKMLGLWSTSTCSGRL